MGKLFGTDGIRGVVGKTLTAELAFHVGQAVAVVLQEELGRSPLITIGKDTRISSDMLEAALTAGICSVGGDVLLLGVIPTPANWGTATPRRFWRRGITGWCAASPDPTFLPAETTRICCRRGWWG